MDQVILQGLNGLSLAGILALVALGLGVTFGLLGVINLAHGELFMLGAYTVLVVHRATGSVWLGIALAPLVVGAVGAVIERVVVKRLYGRPFDTLLATWAVSVVLRQAITLWQGGGYQPIPHPITTSVPVFGVQYPAYRLALLGLGAVCLVLVGLLLYRTRLGVQARAAIQNREVAAAMGVNVGAVDTLMFSLGAAMAGLAGAAMGPLVTVNPSMGLPILASSFFVVILGGTGRLLGVAAGAAIIGGGQAVASFFTNPVVAQVAVLLLAVLVIRVAPQGVFGRRPA
ncbi:MAG TPA: branched-chain amino acid ABC transporter permease [Actinomycetota bacterium]|nr:branched-chain amino acid ABC transporter permease [Actinomycetota bacterium]